MNKKQLKKIKKAMCYEGHPEQKRVLRGVKKIYAGLCESEKVRLILELTQHFEMRRASQSSNRTPK
tara:strand:+ start:23933 stop:24130 length:198 start_codon:yes stop_codon:yes gene_type:complete